MPLIYVIDDSLSVRRALESVLVLEGFEVKTNGDSVDAMAELDRGEFDLVLCDLVMPEVDGLEVCRFVKGNPRLSSTPVLLISGIVDAAVRARANAAGADGLFRKPFARQELAAAVRAALEKARRAQPPETSETADPRAAAANALDQLHDRLGDSPDFHFLLLIDSDGAVVKAVGEASTGLESTAMGFEQLMDFVDSVASRLDQGALEGLSLELEGGLVLIKRLSADYKLVVAGGPEMPFGKARYLARLLQLELTRGGRPRPVTR